MRYSWDDVKAQTNLGKQGLDFADVTNFDWSAAFFGVDRRHDYGELRFRAYRPLYGHIVVLVFYDAQRRLLGDFAAQG